MTPSNLTILNSVREFQKHFNQAFNLAAAASDIVYASTQTISGGLIICRNFTVNSGVTLTISNPTTIICQTFTNNGAISMSAVNEAVLHQYRFSDAPRVPTLWRLVDGHSAIFNSSTTASISGHGGCGGASFGDGGSGTNASAVNSQADGSHNFYTQKPSSGWKTQGMALWWPIAMFKNPVLSIGAGGSSGKNFFSASLAWQTKGGNGSRAVVNQLGSGGGFTHDTISVGAGGNPGSFLEVFSRVSAINAVGASIQCIGATGAGGNNGSGGGGGGGCAAMYSEGFVSQLGTLTVSGGNSGGNFYGAGGGGGGIFLTAPVITNSGTNNVNGGTGNPGAQGGQSGVVFVEPYLRLWMPGEDDVVQGTRYQAT